MATIRFGTDGWRARIAEDYTFDNVRRCTQGFATYLIDQGEESGGYAFRGSVAERDGILGNLYFLDMMVRLNKTPSQLLAHLYEKLGATYYYDRVDTRFPGEKRPEAKARLDAAKPEVLAGMKVAEIVTLDGYKGWLLIRFSGKEPVIRVYCETTDESKVQPLLDEGLELAGLA